MGGRRPGRDVVVTSTVENYLKQILYLRQRAAGPSRAVSTGQLASAMGVVPGTATSMVKALADSGLVEYEARNGVRLTARGEQLALHVLRRHRLVELFLVKVLGLDWTVVHEEADALEHAVSDRVIDRIDRMLGHPAVDPHGDPIPSERGHDEAPHRPSLADCPLKRTHRVSRILDQEPEFLRFIERRGLTPGAMVTVDGRESAGGVVHVRVGKRAASSLGLAAAAKIIVDAVSRPANRKR